MRDFCLDNLDVSLDQGILDTHKGSFGHLLIASGDTGYGGAGIIASESAIMSGCGLVTLITKKEHIQSSLSRNPEVIAIGVGGRQDAETFLKDQKNLLIGPGLRESVWSQQLCELFLTSAERNEDINIVIDAGGLYYMKEFGCPSNAIITPHPGEAAMLLDCSVEELQKNRLEAAKELYKRYNCLIILKGYQTIVFDGEAYQCTDGGPALSTAGTGDVLAGLIGSFLAQGLSKIDAARFSVAIHGAAGDKFSKNKGGRGLTATKLIKIINEEML